ncbi:MULTISPECIES: NAD(P)H-binding protein, partial [unclassified Mycobacterium]|uniref:NAD(P)H-binding protein n=1 Tax=unclassified Mycobacterium TaxID=2642494 RepID=UPI000AFC296D
MHCVVFGATGYLGTRLIPRLLENGHSVRVLARDPAKLDGVSWLDRVEVVQGDVIDAGAVRRALEGRQVLYYLVHSLMRPDFVDFDERAARNVAECAAQAGVSRIVYVGGITPDGQELSDHLASRAQVGKLFLASGVPAVELRAAAVIGAGSASFEMLRYLTERLPVIVAPRWLRTRVQPIAVHDVLYYLVRAAELPAEVNRPFDIGGPDRFTYTEMIRKYAVIAGLPRRPAVPVPLLTPRLSAPWVDLLTPLPRQLAVSLMESLENDVVCADHDIARYIPCLLYTS